MSTGKTIPTDLRTLPEAPISAFEAFQVSSISAGAAPVVRILGSEPRLSGGFCLTDR
jgi:hypothetical protein